MPLTVIRVSEITPKSKEIILLAVIFISDPASTVTAWLTTTLDPTRISLLLATVAETKATLVASMLTEDSSSMEAIPIAYLKPEADTVDELDESACPIAYLRPKATTLEVLNTPRPDCATLVPKAVAEEADCTCKPLNLMTLADAEDEDSATTADSPIAYLVAAAVDVLCAEKSAWPRLTP